MYFDSQKEKEWKSVWIDLRLQGILMYHSATKTLHTYISLMNPNPNIFSLSRLVILNQGIWGATGPFEGYCELWGDKWSIRR